MEKSIDPAKIGRWFDNYTAGLLLYARQWLEASQAEDVVQEVFVRLIAQTKEPERSPHVEVAPTVVRPGRVKGGLGGGLSP